MLFLSRRFSSVSSATTLLERMLSAAHELAHHASSLTKEVTDFLARVKAA
jgi:hypothetical protein